MVSLYTSLASGYLQKVYIVRATLHLLPCWNRLWTRRVRRRLRRRWGARTCPCSCSSARPSCASGSPLARFWRRRRGSQSTTILHKHVDMYCLYMGLRSLYCSAHWYHISDVSCNKCNWDSTHYSFVRRYCISNLQNFANLFIVFWHQEFWESFDSSLINVGGDCQKQGICERWFWLRRPW